MEKPKVFTLRNSGTHMFKKKSEFSLYLSILCSSLLAQISSSLQEMADVATGKSGLHPSSPKLYLEKHAFFSVSMIGRLQLCPNIQPRMNLVTEWDGHSLNQRNGLPFGT